MYTVIAQRQIPVPPDELWPFLTAPDRLALWFADTELFAPGAAFRFDYGDGDFFAGRVHEWEPGIALGLRWRFLGLGPEYEVRYSMLRRKDGTELSIQDRGALTVKEAECLRVGWSEFLMRLEKAVVSSRRSRFSWRRAITFTGRVEDGRAALQRALSDGEWYRGCFPGARAEVKSAGAGAFAGVFTAESWNEARTPVRLSFDRIRGVDYLFVAHEGWGALPSRTAADERRRYLDLWMDALTPLAVS